MFVNDGKTQYLPIVPKSADALVDKSVIRVGTATITASLCVQCLGVCIDRHLDMKKQVSQPISACSFYLRNINQISRFLPRPTKERVVNALVTSRLDYCYALLYGTSALNIARLQRTHNTAARLIMRSPRSDSGPCIYRFFLFRFQICERKSDNEFVFRFSFSNLRTKNEFLFRFSFSKVK